MTLKPNGSEHHSEQTERSTAKQSDKDAVKAPILDKRENNAQIKQQEREHLKTFRFTKDSNNSFTIGMADGSSVVDRRPIGKPESSAPTAEARIFEAVERAPEVFRSGSLETTARADALLKADSAIPSAVQSYLKQLSASNAGLMTSEIPQQIAQTSKDAPHHASNGEHSALRHHERHAMTVHEQVLAKEHELTHKYGVHFTRPGESLGHKQDLNGKYGAEIHSREPSLAELTAIEKALQHAGPELDTGKHGHKLTFAFPDQQRHDGPPANADFQSHLKHGQTIEIFPEGATKAATDQGALVYELRHEFSHNTIYKIDGMGVACPDEIANKIGFSESNDPVNKLQRTADGRLWRHDPSDDTKHYWTEVDQHGVPKMDKHGHYTQKPFDEVKLHNTSLIEVTGADGKIHYFQHTIGDTGSQYWIRCDKDGHMLDAAGNPTSNKAATEQMSNDDMKKAARVKPPSDYFDDASEAAAEAITNFRFDETKRKHLLKQSPEYYEMAKTEDQKEINKHYGTHHFHVGGVTKEVPNMIRLPNGDIVKNTPAAQAAIDSFEKSP